METPARRAGAPNLAATNKKNPPSLCKAGFDSRPFNFPYSSADKSSSIDSNCDNAAFKSSTISSANISGSGRLAESSSDSSLSQKISKLTFSACKKKTLPILRNGCADSGQGGLILNALLRFGKEAFFGLL